MGVTAVPGRKCRICGTSALRELPQYRTLSRVTSDCKPWPMGGRLTVCDSCGAVQKIADADWLGEIERIYDGYTIYHQSDGAEQPVYDGVTAVGTPRSLKLVNHLVESLRLPDAGRVLDFGCGTGVALRNFAAARPGWELHGSELSERALPVLRKIPGFAQLHTCPPEQIPARFTLITLIHSLEHVLDPVATLSGLRDRVDNGGHVFVQVPDCGRTPYDLLVADHLLHFTLDSLRLAADRAGYRTTFLSDSLLAKELSWIGRPDRQVAAATKPNAQASATRLYRQLAWLAAQVEAAKAMAETSPKFGIFGTSISGTWLYGMLESRVAFFVDEDPGRIGREHMGLPIYAPSSAPANSDVYIPLIPEVAAAVARRHASQSARFHVPPPLDTTAALHVA
jgi:SAM-dependent methyltransferase